MPRPLVQPVGLEALELRRLKDSLQATDQRFQDLFEDAPVACHEIDQNGILLRVNRAECALLGFEASEMLGRPVWKFMVAEERDKSQEAVSRKVAGDEPLVSFEREFTRRDGTALVLEIHPKLIRNAVGHGVGIRSFVIDVTDRKRAEQALRNQALELAKSEQHLREQTRILQCVVDSMGDGVVVADQTGKFLLFNPAAEKALGVGAVEGSPDDWTDQYGIFSADQITPYPATELPLARALRGSSVTAEDLFLRNAKIPDGGWISVTARPLKDEAGRIWGGVAVVGDITDRKRSDQELRAAKAEAENANRAKSEFLSRMSHELRTPLNSILGFAQILKMHELSERPRECVEHILKGGTHLLGLIDEVLDIARIEAGKLSLSSEPVLVSDAVHQALDMVRPLAEARSIRLEASLRRPRQHVLADRQRLHQVLLNLLSNAVKYNRQDGAVEISSEETETGKLRISVRDTGEGITEADQARLFAPFQRLAADQTEVQGTGLGLALSKRLMEALGGTIGVTSLPGRGSTFWIELPRADAPEQAVRQQEQLNAIAIKNLEGTRSVLYIEDNISNMRLMEHIVSYRPQIRLIPAMQGRLGVELAREHKPDLILLDLHLPDLPGDEVVKNLQADPKTSGIPIVMVSADATPGQVSRLLRTGVAAYLTKPINVERLLKVFDDHLADGKATDAVRTIKNPNEARQ